MIDDVIAGVRDPFLDEGVDEQVLQELKQVWTNKLMASKAVEMTPDPAEQSVPPPALANNPKTSNKSGSKSKASRAAQAGRGNYYTRSRSFNDSYCSQLPPIMILIVVNL